MSLILAMLEDRAGTSGWRLTAPASFGGPRDGSFSRFLTEEGLSSPHVECLLEDRAGTLWVGTDGGGLSRFEHGRFTRQPGVPGDQIWALAQDAHETLWVGTTAGLTQLRGGTIGL